MKIIGKVSYHQHLNALDYNSTEKTAVRDGILTDSERTGNNTNKYLSQSSENHNTTVFTVIFKSFLLRNEIVIQTQLFLYTVALTVGILLG